MNTASTISSSTLDAVPRGRPYLHMAVTGALAATIANLALWAGGRVADVDFLVNPPVGAAFRVGALMVGLTTLLMFAAGAAGLALAARRSRRLARAVVVTAAVVAVGSVGGPLSAADYAAAGALLAAMHLVTGAIFVATAKVR